MSMGILGDRAPRVLRGLGGEPPPDPWCWQASGYPWGAAFDACHVRNWKACDGKRYEDKLANKIWTQAQFDDCVNLKDNTTCDCPALNPGARPAGTSTSTSTSTQAALVMGNKTSNPRVVELQQAINAVLTKNGYAAIGTDGKLGPGTCGAAREADKFGAGLMVKYGLTGVCTSFTTPATAGGASATVRSGGGPAPALAPSQSLAPTSQAGFFGMNAPTLALVAAAAVGAWLFLGKKKAA